MFGYFFGATLEKIGNFFNLLSGHTDNNNQLCHRSEPKGQPREHNQIYFSIDLNNIQRILFHCCFKTEGAAWLLRQKERQMEFHYLLSRQMNSNKRSRILRSDFDKKLTLYFLTVVKTWKLYFNLADQSYLVLTKQKEY